MWIERGMKETARLAAVSFVLLVVMLGVLL